MYDFADVAELGNDGNTSPKRLRTRLSLQLIVCYFLAAFLCWEEVRFRSAVEVPATLSVVSHQRDGKSMVRYIFTEPETGKRHQSTVQIRTHQIPDDHNVTAQYLAASDSSRLALQARPSLSWTFFGVNMTFLTIIIGGVVYLAWESTQRMPTRQQRAMAAYHKRKRNEKYERRPALR